MEGKKNSWPDAAFFPWFPENGHRFFAKATSVKGRAGRDNSQCTRGWQVSLMKSLEGAESGAVDLPVNRNLRDAAMRPRIFADHKMSSSLC